MTDLKKALEGLIRKRKTGFGEFVYIYVATNTSCTGKKNVFDVFEADVDAFSKFVSSHKPEEQSRADFETGIKLAISGVCFEDEDKDKAEDNEEKTEKYFEGPLSPDKLRREFQITVSHIKNKEKIFEFIKALPGVLEVHSLKSHNNKFKPDSMKISVKFIDVESVEKLTPDMLKCEDGIGKLHFGNSTSNHDHFMKRPFWQMGNLMRSRVSFLRFYLKGLKDEQNSTIDREVVINQTMSNLRKKRNNHAPSQEERNAILAKWKKAMADWEIKDVETVRLLVNQARVIYLIVVFKTKEAAEGFVNKSLDLEMDENKVMAEMVTRIPDIINLVGRDGAGVETKFFTGVEDEAALDKDLTLVVSLFDEGLKDREEIKQFFSNEKPEKIIDLSFKQSSLLGPHPIHPVMLMTFASKEELKQTLLNLDTLNNNRTMRQWVFALPLKELMHEKKAFMPADVKEDAKECKEMFEMKDDVIEMKLTNRKTKEKKESLLNTSSQKDALVKETAKEVTNVEMGEWVTCILDRNPRQVRWDSRDSQEIGRYFFENHLNVAEIKMRTGSSYVYTRFNTCKSAAEFLNLSYALFLGVKITRRSFPETPEFKNNNIRAFLGGTRLEDGRAQEKNGQQTNGSAQQIEEKLNMSLGLFSEKFSNHQLFDKLKEEIGLERSDIVRGGWEKVDDKWKATVVMGCDAEKLTKYILSWNKKGVNMGGKVIEAELQKVAGKAGKKRRNTDNKSELSDSKKARSFIENY